jgi:hypothetical protein
MPFVNSSRAGCDQGKSFETSGLADKTALVEHFDPGLT